ncbi:VanZ family protein [Isoptericola sp. NPDC057191]|uniref:VanZ family protein n=1 Tax=Isoptericola sp. NPDC057191 TaxID=3346041 RepID=UPI003644F6E1
MVDRWAWPAMIGIGFGVVAFLAVLVPVLLVQQRRYGRLDARRVLGAAALAVYVVTLLAYTMLPLPSGDLVQWCAAHGVAGAELTPLHSLDDVRRDTAGLGLLATLRSVAVLQVAFNVLLFVPWGVLARRYLGWGVVVSTVSALVASVGIETVQYTGIFGLIPCSYRVADVDDVLANTLGGLVGALVAPVVLRWMPQSRALSAARLEPRPVTFWRRLLGMLTDLLAAFALGAALQLAYRAGVVATGHELPSATTWPDVLLGTVVPAVLVFFVPPWVGTGASLGQRAVWLEPRWPDGAGGLRRGSLPHRVARGYLLLGLYGALGVVEAVPPGDASNAWAGTLQNVVALAALVGVAATRDRRGLACALTGARLVDARVPVDPDLPDPARSGRGPR